MNDEAKRLMIRFKKSKDFYKTIEKLKKENYIVYSPTREDKGMIVNGEQTNTKMILVGRDKINCLLTVVYEENNNVDSEYRQSIHYMKY